VPARRKTLLALACAAGLTAAQADEPVQALPAVLVVRATPLPGLGLAPRDVPANVQGASGDDVARLGGGNLARYLENGPGSVTANAAQGNAYQSDISFRGFTASPLLGTPQGLSVFVDGVRVNEPFGDAVNWDLIPQFAIAGLQLVPGSNPLFGLNTLGGSLALQTKSGVTHPGGSIELNSGSFGRRTLELEQGGVADGGWDYYLAGHAAHERGWAEHNPSRIAQFFGKLGRRGADGETELSLLLADNHLEGSQTLPLSFLDTPRQAYTWPDANHNRAAMLTLKGSLRIDGVGLLGGNVYWRRTLTDNLSSNVDGDQATNDRSSVAQTGYGFGLQLTLDRDWGGLQHRLVFGGSVDIGTARFTQQSQPAEFTASRGTQGLAGFEPETDAGTRNRALGLFITDTVKLSPRWTLTASGRHNDVHLRIQDRSGSASELNGRHGFSRFNPALGLNFNPDEALTLYASYNEGLRTPTAMELTCADPQAPCKLPNSFLSDPPLKPVVARTVEVGARGKAGPARWSAALYRTALQDDILFVSSGGGGSNAGYFRNVGSTLRQGLELGLSARQGPWNTTLRYSRILASYRSSFVEHSPFNPSADAGGDIQVMPGNRLPGIPRDNLKLRVEWTRGDELSFGLNLLASGASFSRGDENNASGDRVPGYAVVHADARWTLSPRVEGALQLNNLFDRRYANFGLLGRNVFTGPGRSFDPAQAVNEPFRGLGAPRGVWLGLRYGWG
jgi:outer membrane receptor protein involved in Fe transport